MTGLYAPGYAAMMGGWPGAVPNPFAFPTPGVILPTQFRRYRSATLSQIWRPLPEYSYDHRRLALPAVTPKRRTSQMRSSPTVAANLRSDYGWNDYDLSTILYPPRQSTPISPKRRRPQWTPFRATRSESEDEDEITCRSQRANPRKIRQQWKEGQDVMEKDSTSLRTEPSWLRSADRRQESDERFVCTPRSKRIEPLRNDWSSAVRQSGGFVLRGRNNATTPICTREGYWTKPSIEALASYSDNRLSTVEDFTVIRDGFGEVVWPGLTDVRGLNVDQVVEISDKSIEVYPEGYTERTGHEVPEVGVGLNKTALITLLNCR